MSSTLLALNILGLSMLAEVCIIIALFYFVASFKIFLHMGLWLWSNIGACSTTRIEVAIFGGWSIWFWYTSGLHSKFTIPALTVDAFYCCMMAWVNRKILKRWRGQIGNSSASSTEIKLEHITVLPGDWNCSICMQGGLPAVAVGCGHNFHKVCIETWAKKSATCPLCRSRLGVF